MNGEDEDNIKWAAMALYGGGASTIVSTISSFILAMVMFPEAQRKAPEEIDGLIGSGRLPQFKDQDRLPYIQGIVKEIYRCAPVAPMDMAHMSKGDINYNGYLVPKGAYLLPATWWFCQGVRGSEFF